MGRGQANLASGLVYEVKTLRYSVAGKTMATIEILKFHQDTVQYAGQAKIEVTGEECATHAFNSEEEAINAIILEVEERIVSDHWVQKTENNIKKYLK